MDLIYMNHARQDIGVLTHYDLDLAIGKDENDFVCKVNVNSNYLQGGYYLYMEGTEYGGVVDAIEYNSVHKEVSYKGRTWHGLLNSKVVEPDRGEAYLICNGEGTAVVAMLLSRYGLDKLFTVAEDSSSSVIINNYKFERYCLLYDGIKKMLSAYGMRLGFAFRRGMVELKIEPIHDYTQDEQFDSSLVDFQVTKNHHSINHLVCLGKGEGAERVILHLYTDENGNISETQTFTGLDEYADVYDFSSAETDELKEYGIERFKDLKAADELSIEFDEDSDIYNIGDIVGAYDSDTGISAASAIIKKIVQVSNGRITISYEVGE